MCSATKTARFKSGYTMLPPENKHKSSTGALGAVFFYSKKCLRVQSWFVQVRLPAIQHLIESYHKPATICLLSVDSLPVETGHVSWPCQNLQRDAEDTQMCWLCLHIFSTSESSKSHRAVSKAEWHRLQYWFNSGGSWYGFRCLDVHAPLLILPVWLLKMSCSCCLRFSNW